MKKPVPHSAPCRADTLLPHIDHVQKTIDEVGKVVDDVNKNVSSIRMLASLQVEDIFLSFVYAAAVHITILHFLQKTDIAAMKKGWMLFVLGLLVFFAIDWLSRARIRQQLLGDFPLATALAKPLLEVAAVYFLIIAAAAIIEIIPSDADATTQSVVPGAFVAAMTGYAFLTFFWNLLIFKFMKDLEWWTLTKAVFSGRVLALAGVKEYTAAWVDALVERLQEDVDRHKQQFDKALGRIVWTPVKYGALGWVAQVAATHVAMAHLLVGVRLSLTILWPTVSLLGSPPWWIFLFLALVSFCCFVCGKNLGGGIAHSITTIFAVIYMPPLLLVLALAIQQSLVALLLQFAISRGNVASETPASSVAMLEGVAT